MESDFDGVRLQAEQLADLPGSEVGAVAQCEQLAIALVETSDRCRQIESPNRFFRQLARPRPVRRFGNRQRPRSARVLDAAPCDPDKPRAGLALARVIARAVAKRAL